MLIYTIMGYEALFDSQTPQNNAVCIRTKLSCNRTRLTVQNTQTSDLLKKVIQNGKKM